MTIEDNALKMKQRFIQIRKELGLSQVELASAIECNSTAISKIENPKELKRRPTLSIMMAMEEKFNVNRHYIENGEGEMFIFQAKSYPRLEANPVSLASDPADYDNDGTRFEELPDGTIRMRVPVIPYKAFAGYLRGFQDPEFYEELPYISVDVTKQHRGHYLAFEVKGDSMTTLEPDKFRQSIFDGVTVVGRELAKHHWRYKLHTNNYDNWVIVHKTEGILLKQILEHDIDNGTIRLHSLNPDKKAYPDQVLLLNDVEQIFNVVQKIDK